MDTTEVIEDASNLGKKVAKLSDENERHGQIIYIVLIAFVAIVLAGIFSLGAIWNDYLAMKQATYADLRDKVVNQNYRIDSLEEELQKTNTILQGAKFIYMNK